MRTTSFIWASVVACSLSTTAVQAERCPADSAARLRFIRAAMAETAKRERRFALGWGLTYTALSAGSPLLLALPHDHGDVIDTYWNVPTAALGGMAAVIPPLLVLRDQRRLEALAAGADPCVVLKDAERLFIHAAESEAGARGLVAQLGNLLSNAALGLTLAYGLGRAASAAQNMTIGIITGEIMMITRPLQAVQSLASYRRGDLTDPRPRDPATLDFSLTLNVTRGSYGAGLVATF